MKWFGWLIRTMISTAVMTSVSVAVTWSMMNIYVQQFLGPFQGEQITRPIQLTDLVSYMVTQATGNGMKDPNAPADENEGNETPTEAVDEPLPQEAPQTVPDNALPVMGGIQSGEEGFISTEELDVKKDSITPEDRVEIFSILTSELPPEEMQNISKLLEGGITPEEIQEASKILKENLSEEEYNKLIEILMKY